MSLFDEAKNVIPGGVNSPVRSFKSVGGEPVFADHASGAYIYNEKGRSFIDYCLSWGALILGHANNEVNAAINDALSKGTSFGMPTVSETMLAKAIIEAMPSIEKVRLTSSGTEAVMSAIRLARGYTKRKTIIKFDGAYHGHADYLLVQSGSGAATLNIPFSAGVPEDFIKYTKVLPYNDIEKVKELSYKISDDLAAIIVEPVMANSGVILPNDGFLPALREIADKTGAILIFDEIITGFRLGYGGAQEYFNVKADLTCLGKIVGGGMPLGAFGGKKEIMDLLAPIGDVYQAGTLSGNPLATRAGLAVLQFLKKEKPYEKLSNYVSAIANTVIELGENFDIPVKVNHIASMFSIFFTPLDVTDYEKAAMQDPDTFNSFFHAMLREGIYFSPSSFEADFVSICHGDNELDRTIKAINNQFKNL